jgi:hypothetical protein
LSEIPATAKCTSSILNVKFKGVASLLTDLSRKMSDERFPRDPTPTAELERDDTKMDEDEGGAEEYNNRDQTVPKRTSTPVLDEQRRTEQQPTSSNKRKVDEDVEMSDSTEPIFASPRPKRRTKKASTTSKLTADDMDEMAPPVKQARRRLVAATSRAPPVFPEKPSVVIPDGIKRVKDHGATMSMFSNSDAEQERDSETSDVELIDLTQDMKPAKSTKNQSRKRRSNSDTTVDSVAKDAASTKKGSAKTAKNSVETPMTDDTRTTEVITSASASNRTGISLHDVSSMIVEKRSYESFDGVLDDIDDEDFEEFPSPKKLWSRSQPVLTNARKPINDGNRMAASTSSASLNRVSGKDGRYMDFSALKSGASSSATAASSNEANFKRS